MRKPVCRYLWYIFCKYKPVFYMRIFYEKMFGTGYRIKFFMDFTILGAK